MDKKSKENEDSLEEDVKDIKSLAEEIVDDYGKTSSVGKSYSKLVDSADGVGIALKNLRDNIEKRKIKKKK